MCLSMWVVNEAGGAHVRNPSSDELLLCAFTWAYDWTDEGYKMSQYQKSFLDIKYYPFVSMNTFRPPDGRAVGVVTTFFFFFVLYLQTLGKHRVLPGQHN